MSTLHGFRVQPDLISRAPVTALRPTPGFGAPHAILHRRHAHDVLERVLLLAILDGRHAHHSFKGAVKVNAAGKAHELTDSIDAERGFFEYLLGPGDSEVPKMVLEGHAL